VHTDDTMHQFLSTRSERLRLNMCILSNSLKLCATTNPFPSRDLSADLQPLWDFHKIYHHFRTPTSGGHRALTTPHMSKLVWYDYNPASFRPGPIHATRTSANNYASQMHVHVAHQYWQGTQGPQRSSCAFPCVLASLF